MKSMAMAVVLVCAWAGSAGAKDLGEQGALSINGAFSLDFASRSNSANDTTTTSIRVAPNGDFFAIPNVSLGGGFLVDYSKTGSSSTTSYGLQGRAGYYLPIGSAGHLPPGRFSYPHRESHISPRTPPLQNGTFAPPGVRAPVI